MSKVKDDIDDFKKWLLKWKFNHSIEPEIQLNNEFKIFLGVN